MPAEPAAPQVDGHRFIPCRRIRQIWMRYQRLCYNDVTEGAVRVVLRLRNEGERSFSVPLSTVDQERGTVLGFVVGEAAGPIRRPGAGRPIVVRFTAVEGEGMLVGDERELLDIATAW